MNSRIFLTTGLAALAVVVISMNLTLLKGEMAKREITIETTDNDLAEVKITGTSMEPTIRNGDVFMADVSDDVAGTLSRGDIVIIKQPDHPDATDLFVKRVVGFAGETVEIRYGKLYVNDIYKYYGAVYNYDYGPYTVEADAIFVLGDNPTVSYDSRSFNNPSVNIGLIVGQILLEE